MDNKSDFKMSWEYISQLQIIKLYAGDIPDQSEYNGLIGLSLTNNDHRHIKHDISKPFPLPDNSVWSFQAEDVLEHILYDNLAPIINEIYRMLRPNGLFRLSIPDYGCEILQNRSLKDEKGNIVFDPGGGGTLENPGHIWFPRIDKIKALLNNTAFSKYGTIDYLHYYCMNDDYVMRRIDYSKGHIKRTPDHDSRASQINKPMSMVIDLIKSVSHPSSNTITSKAAEHYDSEYYKWQSGIGAFGGVANIFKFNNYIKQNDTVIDFGCGGGYLLQNIECSCRIGIEINENARKQAVLNGVTVYETIENVPNNIADVIISNHALEHTVSPYESLALLYNKLKPNGLVIFVVPHQDTREEYNPDDINKHLYTWNQLTLGNLFTIVGYNVLKVETIQHQWPPDYQEIYTKYGEEEFHKICNKYAIQNINYQIRIIAAKQ